MITNGDNGYSLLAADWLGPKVSSHLAPFLYSSREPSELSQRLCHDDSTINIVVVIIIISKEANCTVYDLRYGVRYCCRPKPQKMPHRE